MTSIKKATIDDLEVITTIAPITFRESHGHSAVPKEIDAYIAAKYNPGVLGEELNDPGNLYHIIYHNDQPAGYSKIVFHSPHPDVTQQNITKLERIYLLKQFYGLKLGAELFDLNLELSKTNGQAGMWLYVWEENHRAINFYKKRGFKIIAQGDFKLTETHSNPNHIMYLGYESR
jgi:diamine N-acetyltransferase